MKKMALLRRFNTIRSFYQTFEIQQSSLSLFRSPRSYSTGFSNVPEFYGRGITSCLYKTDNNALPWTCRNTMTLRSTMAAELLIYFNDKKFATTQAKASAQIRKVGTQVSMTSPGFVYEPYAPGEPIPFWKRYFTRTGWRRTKEDIKSELKSAYAIAKLRRSGYSKNQFYKEAIELYKEINTLIANGDKTSLRKAVTENMFSALKNEIKQRESIWSSIYWEMVEPVVKIRTLRARMIGVDKNDFNKAFIQLTLEFLTKEKFEAYDSKGAVVAGDKTKEVLVRAIWVFEKSLFHPGAYWHLCGRIKVLYNFIMKCLATYATKSVTLGHGSHQAFPGAASATSSSMTDQVTNHTAQESALEDTSLQAKVEQDPVYNHKEDQEMGDISISSATSQEEKNEEEATVSAIGAEAQPPKKMVSINETVEEIAASRKKSKKKKRTEKMGSFDQEIEEPKPLKSILKVGSKLYEDSSMINSSNLGSDSQDRMQSVN
ncbi:hypothetical protein REPUB_Repub06bG0023400 [Reevesia pubescens]